ncbi:MAG: PAS domain-containing protein, partial [Methanosarcinales archaeon]|nr:PAS domain-containing protein [Methanosarcinales archaeon]
GMVLRDGELKNYRTTALTKDKKPVQISMSAALLKDSDGVPIGTVRISRDVTKEVEFEERIEEERDNLNLIFDSMADGVYIVSKDYEIEFMNKVLIDEFGDRVGGICYKMFHNREEPCPLCKNPEVMKGKTVQWEWNSGRRNKTYDLIETPQKNIDGTISKLTLFRDITERKLAGEKLEKKIEELRRFNEMTVDRELKMVELKKKINALLQESGKEPRYKILEQLNTGTSR